jgi:dolichyl-phosphate beta-glucosyltransferase
MSDARPERPRLSVVLPAYREAERVGATIERIRTELGAGLGPDGFEIVVVDDGSDDDTRARAEAAGADQVIRHAQNRGKGAAVRTGMLSAAGRTIAFTDADLAYAPSDLVAVLEAIEGGADVAVGSRRHSETETVVEARWVRAAGGRVINLLTHVVLRGRYLDTQSGLKGFRREAAEQIFSHTQIDGFAFDIEVLHLVERYGFSVTEVPVRVTNSTRSSVHVVRDGLRLVADLARIRWFARSGAYEVVE